MMPPRMCHFHLTFLDFLPYTLVCTHYVSPILKLSILFGIYNTETTITFIHQKQQGLVC